MYAALHWAAFLLVISMMLLPNVQRILNASATGLAVLMLLALGTFTAGVHVLSWQVCLLGIIMALGVPARHGMVRMTCCRSGANAFYWR
jgi:hypothetical protein